LTVCLFSDGSSLVIQCFDFASLRSYMNAQALLRAGARDTVQEELESETEGEEKSGVCRYAKSIPISSVTETPAPSHYPNVQFGKSSLPAHTFLEKLSDTLCASFRFRGKSLLVTRVDLALGLDESGLNAGSIPCLEYWSWGLVCERTGQLEVGFGGCALVAICLLYFSLRREYGTFVPGKQSHQQVGP